MLKLIVDKLEDVEEAFRPLYVEKDGKFHLQVDGIEDPAPLKRNLEAARRAERAMKVKVEAWEKLGKTDEEIAALIAKAEQDQLSEAEKKGEWDKLKQQMNDKHAADLKKVEGKLTEKDQVITGLRSSLERHLVDANATAAIAQSKGVSELLLPHVRKHVKVVEEDGEFKVSVVNGKGEPRVNGKGEPLSIAELVTEMKASEIFGRAFDATGNSGGGAPPGGGGNGPVNGPKRRSEFKSEKERAAYVDANGIGAYNALPL